MEGRPDKKPVRRQLGSGLGLGFGKERHYRGTAILGVSVDGIVGEKTLAAINGRNARELFADIKRARISFIEGIIKRDPSQMVFKKGWLSRLNCINYGSLTLNKKGKDKILNFTDV